MWKSRVNVCKEPREQSAWWAATCFLFVLTVAFSVFPAGSAYSADGYTVPYGGSVTINEHGLCRIVTNNNTVEPTAIFVPTSVQEEWLGTHPESFVANPPPGVTLAPCKCTLDGVDVAEGDSITAYLDTRACEQACADIDQIRTCSGGTLDGDPSYNKASCPAMTACKNCPLDGVTVVHRDSRVFYNDDIVPCGSSCTGQNRNCFDGTLDGSATYQYANCTIDMCPFVVMMDPTLGNDGTTTRQVTIPTGTGSFNYEVRWRQGAGPTTTISGLTGDRVINLSSTAPVRIEIRGTFPHWGGTTTNYGVTDILQWGEIAWGSMANMFAGETGLSSYSAVDTPDLTAVTDMSGMFWNAIAFNGDISGWNVSMITNMSNTFNNADAFNQPIGSWNVGSVTSMRSMFSGAAIFNQGLGTWNTSSVTDMGFMFVATGSFNQPINTWNTSNVTDMAGMFRLTKSFNQPIGSWDVSKVTAMFSMFSDAEVFNQPIGSWNVSSVTNMNQMFRCWMSPSCPFNQPIGSWNVGVVTSMERMFEASDFNQPIGSWNVSNVTSIRSMFRNNTVFNQDIGSWDVSSITDTFRMEQVFEGATAFDQDISGWCVTNITTKPTDFDTSTSAGWVTAEKPNWGSCGPVAVATCHETLPPAPNACSGFSPIATYTGVTTMADCKTLCESTSGTTCCSHNPTSDDCRAYNTNFVWDSTLQGGSSNAYSCDPVGTSPANCTVGGVTVLHNNSRTFYRSTRDCHLSCTQVDTTRTCYDGFISGISWTGATCPAKTRVYDGVSSCGTGSDPSCGEINTTLYGGSVAFKNTASNSGRIWLSNGTSSFSCASTVWFNKNEEERCLLACKCNKAAVCHWDDFSTSGGGYCYMIGPESSGDIFTKTIGSNDRAWTCGSVVASECAVNSCTGKFCSDGKGNSWCCGSTDTCGSSCGECLGGI